MNNRIEQLDSIRGLAAFSVMLSHLPIIGMPIIIVNLMNIFGLVNGNGAVMLFFALSGFVLSIPFFEKKEINYVPYIIKRFFRIYVPYLVMIILAIILSQLFLKTKVHGLNDFIESEWGTSVNLKLILEHIYLIGNIHSNSFNGVIWSLIQELRISLIFPFVLMVVKRLNWILTIMGCFCLSLISGLNYYFQFQISNGFSTTYFDTTNYLSIFILGSLLAKNKQVIVDRFKNSNPIYKITLLIISFILYSISGSIIMWIYKTSGLKVLSLMYLIINDYCMAIGGIGFFIIAISSIKAQKILLTKPIKFLGKISYSLYLYHPIVLLSFFHIFYNVLPLWLINNITIAASIIFSYMAWKFIENPSLIIGRKIANKLNYRNKRALSIKLAGNRKKQEGVPKV